MKLNRAAYGFPFGGATLVDFGCLGLLIWLTRREGIGLRDLIGFAKSKLKFDVPLG